MSSNFHLFLDGESFCAEAWLEIIAPCGGHPQEPRLRSSSFVDEWICGDESDSVWVTLTPATGTASAPPWARWRLSIDFHVTVFGEVITANAIILRGLRWLPVFAPGVRVGAVDGQAINAAVVETVDAWAEQARGWMPRDAVDELVEHVEQNA